jgi:serine/threonine protein kinase
MTPDRWQQINNLYQAALEREVQEREAYLREVCAGDEELRREVEDLLGHHQVAATFMDTPALDVAARVLARTRDRKLVGRQLGPYQILSLLGAGGMGEVYLACDARLERQVALKVLPSEVTRDPESLKRFVREAKAASALNHPNIATIHEIGEAEGTHFISMEYVEGDTLEASIRQNRLELAQILDIGIQLTDALDAAHSKGIIHRDIKSSNLMLTPRRGVKVLDFGLAKRTRQEKLAEERGAGTESQTTRGLIMGTVDYMSPEQVLGQEVDPRTDLFSLGVVLYDMVTGRLPFSGVSPTDTIGKILHTQPEAMTQFKHEVPAELERIVLKCLEKDRELRYQHASDVRADLGCLKRDGEPGTSAAEMSKPSPRWLPLLGTALLLTASMAGVGLWFLRTRNEAPEATLIPNPFTTYPGDEVQPSFSPDGNQVAFTWDGEKQDNADIYMKQVGSESPRRLTTDPHIDAHPSWSPDGQSIAFMRIFDNGKRTVMVIPSNGGRERQVAELRTVKTDAGTGEGLCWHPGGKWLAVVCDQDAVDAPYGIALISTETGEKRQLTSPPKGFEGDDSPAFSPDGRYLAFDRFTQAQGEIYVVSVSAGLSSEGEPKQLTFDKRFTGYPAWASSGTEVVYSSGSARAYSILWRIDASGSGKPKRLPFGGEGGAIYPAISQQNHRLAYSYRTFETTIWRCRIPHGKEKPVPRSKLITSTRIKGGAQYSPDGRAIAYVSWDSGSSEIWICDSDGSRPSQLTHLGGPLPVSPRWSPDGQQLIFTRLAGKQHDICLISAQGGQAKQLTNAPHDVGWPSFSRDGKWIYFTSNRSGDYKVWKIPTGGGDPLQVTQMGGTTPLESWDGEFVYYLKDAGYEADLWRVPVRGGYENYVLGPVLRGNFAVAERGIYFISRWTPEGFPINYFEIATGQVKRASLIPPSAFICPGGLAISPDEGWVLYPEQDKERTDLMLVENFH